MGTSNYVRCLGLQHYESGIQYDTNECLQQLLAKIDPHPPTLMTACLRLIKLDKLESTLCNDCGHTTDKDGVCIDWSLHLEDSSNVQANN